MRPGLVSALSGAGIEQSRDSSRVAFCPVGERVVVGVLVSLDQPLDAEARGGELVDVRGKWPVVGVRGKPVDGSLLAIAVVA